MYGAGMGYFKRLLEGGSLKIEEIHAERNPLFPGLAPEPIPRNLGALIDLVRENPPFSIGLATDGDADRLGAVDEEGVFLTQLQVFGLLALYLLEIRGERGALVKSVTTTSMIQRLGELYDVPVIETAVGFKFIAPIMMAENALAGGEESGGYGFRGHIPERDGILSGLYLLDFMAQTGMKASDLLRFLYEKVGPHHYDRADFPFDPKDRPSLIKRVEESEGITLDGTRIVKRDRTDGFRYILEDGSWLLIRFSGTEPLLRIYAETDSPERVQRLLAEGKRLAGV
jgi:phosphomannomutase